ncbi:cytochrome [Janthinobacterium sp. BJB412]|nr:cytochrome [Janthinobacterium sp. BJB412]
MQPSDPIAAVVHADPYPYYATLAARPGLLFEPRLNLWLAAGAASARAVLEHADCLVRPLGEPVPAAIAGAPAGRVFAELVRMNEGARHTQPKLALQRALAGVDVEVARRRAHALGLALWRERGHCPGPGPGPGPGQNDGLGQYDGTGQKRYLGQDHGSGSGSGHGHGHGDGSGHGHGDGCDLADWMAALPVSAVASLIGFADAELPAVAAWMGEFVACLSPLSDAGQLARAHQAATALLASFRVLLRHASARPQTLLAQVLAEAEAVGWDQADSLLANLVGLLSQTYEATAGLLGNALIARQRQADAAGASAVGSVFGGVSTTSAASATTAADTNGAGARCDALLGGAPPRDGLQWAAALVAAVSRDDPPVQNTRRFVARDCVVAGTPLLAGQTVLVLLAAANHDPAGAGAVFGFGHGAHACPGHALACAIASGALQAAAELPLPARLAWRYRPSHNGRIPHFFNQQETV